MFSTKPNKWKLAKCKRKENDSIVNPHLAFDLRDLEEMRRQGKPISVQNAESMYYEGSTDCSFDLPLDSQRGVDINDMWNHSKSVNNRLSKLGISKVDTAKNM